MSLPFPSGAGLPGAAPSVPSRPAASVPAARLIRRRGRWVRRGRVVPGRWAPPPPPSPPPARAAATAPSRAGGWVINHGAVGAGGGGIAWGSPRPAPGGGSQVRADPAAGRGGGSRRCRSPGTGCFSWDKVTALLEESNSIAGLGARAMVS